MDDVDSLLRVYHSGIQSGELAVGQKEALDRLLLQHRKSVSSEREEPEIVAVAA
jgi:homocitrate synthase